MFKHNRIDANQHFWRLHRGDYDWLTVDLEPIYRDFGPSDLGPLLARADMAGTVLVQAAPTIAETRFLLDLAQTPFATGVIGWGPLDAPDAPEILALLVSTPLSRASVP